MKRGEERREKKQKLKGRKVDTASKPQSRKPLTLNPNYFIFIHSFLINYSSPISRLLCAETFFTLKTVQEFRQTRAHEPNLIVNSEP